MVTINTSYDRSDFKKYFNAEELSDVKVEVFNEAGETLGVLKAHKIILSQIEALVDDLKNKDTISIVGNFDAIETFVSYLYTHHINQSQLTPDLLKIAEKYKESFLEENCKRYIVDSLIKKSRGEIIDEYLYARKNNIYFIRTFIAKFIATHYDEFDLEKDFSKVTNDAAALKEVTDALYSYMKRRLDSNKLKCEVKLSWLEKKEYNFKVSSSEWKLELYRGIEDNEDWLYYVFNKLSTDTLTMDHLSVKLLPNSKSDSNSKVVEKTSEANLEGPTKFLPWAFVMDPANGYIDNGAIKLELEYMHTPGEDSEVLSEAIDLTGEEPPNKKLATKASMTPARRSRRKK